MATVERKDIYDFVVSLTEDEFNQLKQISDNTNRLVEDVFGDVVETGLFVEQEDNK
jgi:ERCC4-type nuclease